MQTRVIAYAVIGNRTYPVTHITEGNTGRYLWIEGNDDHPYPSWLFDKVNLA